MLSDYVKQLNYKGLVLCIEYYIHYNISHQLHLTQFYIYIFAYTLFAEMNISSCFAQ